MIKIKQVFLDNAGTTKVAQEVFDAMQDIFLENYGNPSSTHLFGENARKKLIESRRIIADKIGVDSNEVFFTSGGTESNNLAIKGIANYLIKKGKHIITQVTEHPSILEVCHQLETEGFEITYLKVDKEGHINLDELRSSIRKDTILVSIMHANNEIGTIFPISEIGKICHENKVIFHTDACQSFLKVPLDLTNVDLVTINAHKIHGPKGVGALVIRNGVKLKKLQHGGEQESNIRSGTENLPGIVGFAKACKISNRKDIDYMSKLQEKIISDILLIKDSKLNGPKENRLCNNINVSFKNIEGDSLLMQLSMKGIAVSSGSACTARNGKVSHVLRSIKLENSYINGSIRISISKYTTEEEIDYVISTIKKSVEFLRKMR